MTATLDLRPDWEAKLVPKENMLGRADRGGDVVRNERRWRSELPGRDKKVKTALGVELSNVVISRQVI